MQQSLHKTKKVLGEWKQSSQITLYQAHPSESDTARPQRVCQPRHAYYMPGNPVYCDQNLAQVQNIGTDYSANNYRAFDQRTFRNQFGLPPQNFRYITIILTYLNNHFR